MPSSRTNTAESANSEQLELIDALKTAAAGTWGAPVLGRFFTCTTGDGEPGVQINRSVRGTAVADRQGAARSVRSLLDDRGYDAEVRDSTNVVATGADNRYADFNSVDGISIMHVVSACYAFDLEHDTPTVPTGTPSAP